LEEEIPKPAVFAVKTTIGQEKSVADMIYTRARNFNLPIQSVLAPRGIRGYVFVEARGGTVAEQARAGIKHAKGVIKGEVPFSELEHFLIPKPVVAGMETGNIVELTSGPFKGEKARIMRIDETKEEITVELLEATVPIPVTVRGDHVKVIQKEEEK
jgi:transcriptional antiterminator NusG